jgi:photosystem II stability/assembly factor-like uncharacterized protein
MTTEIAPELRVAYALAPSPDFVRDGVCFVARADGLCRSTDSGLSWQSAYASLQLEAPLLTTTVAVSPFYATDHTAYCGISGAVMRSCDGGTTWLATLLPPPPTPVSALAISPAYDCDGIVLAATFEDGVYATDDGGSRWMPWSFGMMDLNVLALAMSPDYAIDETVFAGTESGVFRSTNGGRAWRETDFPMDCAPVLSLAISPNFSNDATVWAGTESHGLFRSLDGGSHWQRIAPTEIVATVNAIIMAPGQSRLVPILVVQPDTLLISRDDAGSWSPWQAGLRLPAGITCAAAPSGLETGAPLLVGLEDGTVLRL